MEPNTRPVGVFDSGVGGISVLSELVKLMPYENFVYFGDSANAPYGTKPLDKVAELTIHTADMLIAKVKSIIKSDGTEIPCTGEQNRKYAEKLRLKKLPGRFKHGIKTMLYPFYKAVFKRK